MEKTSIKKIVMSAFASALLVGSPVLYAADVAENTASTAADTAINFTADVNYELNTTVTALGAITTGTTNQGTVNISVDQNITAGVGASDKVIKALNITGATTDVNATGSTIFATNVTNSGNIIAGTITSEVTNSGTMTDSIITGDVTNTGTITTGTAGIITGTITNNDAGIINLGVASVGAIDGNGTTNILADVTAGGAITQKTVNVANSKTLTSGGNIIADVTLDGNATAVSNLSLGHDLTGNITDSGDINSTITISGTSTITGDITATSIAAGTSLTLDKVGGVVNADVISGTLLAIDGNTTINGNVTVTTLETVATKSLTMHGNVVGAVTNAGILSTDGNITGAVTNTGLLNITGSTITGAISGAGDVVASGDNNITGTIAATTFTNSGILTSGNTITVTDLLNSGTISTGTNILTATTFTNTGNLTLGNAVHAINTLENNATLTMSAATGGVITGNGTTNIVNTLTATGAITQTTVNVANDVTLTSGGLITANINLDGNATAVSALSLGHNVTGNIIDSGDRNSTITTTADVSITGNVTVGSIVNTGHTSTITGDITATSIAAGTSLTLDKVGGVVNADVISGTLLAIDGNTTINGNVTVTTLETVATKSLTIHGNVVGAVTNAGILSTDGDITGNVANTGLLNITGSTITGAISGAGDVVASGDNNITGVSVIGGDLTNTGILITEATIAVAGNVTNSGTATLTTIGGDVENSGILEATNITGFVTNSGTLDALALTNGIENSGTATVTDITGAVINTGTLNAASMVTGTALTNSGKITTTGNIGRSSATLTSDSTITAGGTVALGNVYVEDKGMKDGVVYTLASGTSISATTTNAMSDTALIDYDVYNSTDNTKLIAEANYKGAEDLNITGNAAQIFNAASNVIASDREIFAEMNTMTASELSQAAATMVPDVSAAGAGAMSLSTGAVATVGSRMTVARAGGNMGGIATGDAMSKVTLWGQAYSTTADQDDVADVSGYDSKGNGIVLGADKQIDDNTIVGAALSFGNTNVNSKNRVTNGATAIDSKQLSVYASQSDGSFYVDGVVSFGTNSNDGSRNIVIGAIQRTATSSYDSSIMSAKVSTGYELKYEGFKITPNMSMTLATISTDSYTETGAGSMNLAVSNADMSKKTVTAGLNVAKKIETPSGATFTPELRVSFQNEMGDKYATSNANFVGSSNTFTTEGLKADSSAMIYGFGANYQTPNKMTDFRFGFDQTQATGYRSDAVSLTARFKF